MMYRRKLDWVAVQEAKREMERNNYSQAEPGQVITLALLFSISLFHLWHSE